MTTATEMSVLTLSRDQVRWLTELPWGKPECWMSAGGYGLYLENLDLKIEVHVHGPRVTITTDWSRQPKPAPAPIDLSWVTTEPVYEGTKWLNWTLLGAKLLLLGMLAAIAVAVVVKA